MPWIVLMFGVSKFDMDCMGVRHGKRSCCAEGQWDSQGCFLKYRGVQRHVFLLIWIVFLEGCQYIQKCALMLYVWWYMPRATIFGTTFWGFFLCAINTQTYTSAVESVQLRRQMRWLLKIDAFLVYQAVLRTKALCFLGSGNRPWPCLHFVAVWGVSGRWPCIRTLQFPPMGFSFQVLQKTKMSPFSCFDLQTTHGVGRLQQCLLYYVCPQAGRMLLHSVMVKLTNKGVNSI